MKWIAYNNKVYIVYSQNQHHLQSKCSLRPDPTIHRGFHSTLGWSQKGETNAIKRAGLEVRRGPHRRRGFACSTDRTVLWPYPTDRPADRSPVRVSTSSCPGCGPGRRRWNLSVISTPPSSLYVTPSTNVAKEPNRPDTQRTRCSIEAPKTGWSDGWSQSCLSCSRIAAV